MCAARAAHRAAFVTSAPLAQPAAPSPAHPYTDSGVGWGAPPGEALLRSHTNPAHLLSPWCSSMNLQPGGTPLLGLPGAPAQWNGGGGGSGGGVSPGWATARKSCIPGGQTFLGEFYLDLRPFWCKSGPKNVVVLGDGHDPSRTPPLPPRSIVLPTQWAKSAGGCGCGSLGTDSACHPRIYQRRRGGVNAHKSLVTLKYLHSCV